MVSNLYFENIHLRSLSVPVQQLTQKHTIESNLTKLNQIEPKSSKKNQKEPNKRYLWSLRLLKDFVHFSRTNIYQTKWSLVWFGLLWLGQPGIDVLCLTQWLLILFRIFNIESHGLFFAMSGWIWQMWEICLLLDHLDSNISVPFHVDVYNLGYLCSSDNELVFSEISPTRFPTMMSINHRIHLPVFDGFAKFAAWPSPNQVCYLFTN